MRASASGFTSQTQSGISITTGNTTSANFSLPGQSPITYTYDELGRLVGAADSLSDAVTYKYDAYFRVADDTHGTVLAVANRAGSKDRSDLNGYTFIRSKHCTARVLANSCLEQTSDRYRIHLQGDLRLYE